MVLGLEPDKRQFHCHQCQKTYRDKTSLTRHLRWACGKLPQFRCNYCQYETKWRFRIKEHFLRNHTEMKTLRITPETLMQYLGQ